MNFDDMKFAVESLTGGTNTVLLDNKGLPSVVVAFPKHSKKELFGGTDATHGGHIVNGTEKDVIYVDKFENVVMDSRGYSLPGKDPATSVNFDQAVSYARNKGNGWSVLPFATWAEIALWCRMNGTMPHGNDQFGASIDSTKEKGIPVYTYVDSGDKTKKTGRIATGSGPASWYHDGTKSGIADLCGNIWEWTPGLRLNNGEIQIIQNANVFDSSVDLSSASSAWKAIKSDGTLVSPGTAGTLKYGATNLMSTTTTVAEASKFYSFSAMTLDTGLTAPEIAKELILYPAEPGKDYGSDFHAWDTSGERVAFCGGSWGDGASAGVFYVDLYYGRSGSYDSLGFRSAYCKL